MTKWQTVHVRVNDASTGKPTPVRILFEADGRTFAPFGRVSEFSTAPGEQVGGQLQAANQRYSYINGACEIRLPAGEISIEVSKGPEYAPLITKVQLKPGQLAIRLTIDRWINLRETGWVSGDSHAIYLTPHAALLEAGAEDLAIVNLLALAVRENVEHPWALPNMVAFSGQEPALKSPEHQVIVNTRNSHPTLGTLGLLASHRAVFPLRFGEVDDSDHWSLLDWCEQCHRKKGLVVWSDLHQSRLRSEALADVILGEIDAWEITHFPSTEPSVLGEWYQLLNAGLRIPLAGGSGKDSNAIALGNVRTYAFLGPNQEWTYLDWIEAIRDGRTFVSNGPMLTCSVDSQIAGSVLTVHEGQSVHIQTEMKSIPPVDCLEILVNGEVVEVKEVSGNRQTGILEIDWEVESSCWIAARCWCEEQLADDQCIYAHTSPIYLEVEGAPRPRDEYAIGQLKEHLEAMMQWAKKEARCETDKERQHFESIFQRALEKLATF